MSNDDLNDDMELNGLLAEYRIREESETKQQQENSDDCEKTVEKDDSMDNILFGDKAKLIKNLKKAATKRSLDKKICSNEIGDGTKHKKTTKNRKPVWADEDDEDIQLGDVRGVKKKSGRLDHLKIDQSYKEYLTSRFTRIVNQPKWASLDENVNKESEDDDDLLRTVGFLNKVPESILMPGNLNVKKMKDLNRATYGEGVVNTIQFHPTSTAALVAGDKGIATIYAVDGTQNDKLHNIYIKNFPIKCGSLLPCGTKAIFGSFRRVAYMYDLINAKEKCFYLKKNFGDLRNFIVSPCGRYLVAAGMRGEIHIYEAKTFEIIKTLKQNYEIASLCFTSDSQRLLVSGKSSNVSVFSMRQQKQEHKFIDDGCVVGSVMNLSPNQRLLATGSEEGVVNVYDFEKVMLTSTPKPEKTLLNLRTGISSVRFNHSSELLAYCSSVCKDAVRIAHFPSGTTYSNFPCHMPKFGNVRCLEFSPQSAFLALGTEKKCPLLRIKHFQNY